MKILNLFHFILPAAMVLILAGCDTFDSASVPSQQEQQALAKSDRLIVPGQRIGPIRLGMGNYGVEAVDGLAMGSQTTTSNQNYI